MKQRLTEDRRGDWIAETKGADDKKTRNEGEAKAPLYKFKLPAQAWGTLRWRPKPAEPQADQ